MGGRLRDDLLIETKPRNQNNMTTLMTTLPTTTHVSQFNDACLDLNFSEETINRITNLICEDGVLSEEILGEFFANTQIASHPLSANWTQIVIHLWLDLD